MNHKIFWTHAVRVLVIASFVAIPMFAQGPFQAPVNAALAFALTFAKAASVIAIIVGGLMMALGDGHGRGGFIGILLGVGLMAMAQATSTWLFG